MRWVGWWRRREGEPWQRACEADSLDECSRKLNAATKGLRIKDVNLMMTGGGYPLIGGTKNEKANTR